MDEILQEMVNRFVSEIQDRMDLNQWSLARLTRIAGVSNLTIRKTMREKQAPSLRTAICMGMRVGMSHEEIIECFTLKRDNEYVVRRLLTHSAAVQGMNPWMTMPTASVGGTPEADEYLQEILYEVHLCREEEEVPSDLKEMTPARREVIEGIRKNLLQMRESDLNFWGNMIQHYITIHRRKRK